MCAYVSLTKAPKDTAFDEVRVRGIRSKGFGQLPKLLMLDTALSTGAKAVAAYFYSYTGGGSNAVFPTRDKIINDLNVHKDTYYKYLHELIELGYLSVRRSEVRACSGYTHNIYTLECFPHSYETQPPDCSPTMERLLSRARLSGDINSAGYGNVPKALMTDPTLHFKAKALYAYLCVYSGASLLALPDKSTTLFYLGISAASYERYMRDLEAHGYISRRHYKENGRFHGTMIILDPAAGVRPPDTQKPDMQNPDKQSRPHRQKPDMQKPDTHFSDVQKPDTNKNDSLPRMNLTTNVLNQSITRVREKPEPTDGLIESKQSREEILSEMVEAGTMPYGYCYERSKLETAIEILTDSDRCACEEPAERQRYRLFVNALADMLDASLTHSVIRGAYVSFAKVHEVLSETINAGYDERGEPYAEAFQLYENVAERYRQSNKTAEIRNPLGYMKAMIWTELTTGQMETEDQFRHDMAIGGI